MDKKPPVIFITASSKPHYQIAGEMAEDVKRIIYEYADKIPLALAIGVLRIVEKELMDEST